MKRIFTFLFCTIMATSLMSQEMPAVDKISTSAGTMEMHFIGHGTLRFIINNYIIDIDPVKSYGSYAGLPKSDLILVTHDHSDHLDAGLIAELRKESTVMFANAKSAGSVNWAKVMKPGDKEVVNGFTIEAVYAYNIKNVRAGGIPYHPKGEGNGYILTIGGKRIYVAGDTENTPEMKSLKNIDIAFLPMNLPYTMTPEMVADAALAIKPGILYPYHYGSTDVSQLVKLLQNSGIELRIRNLK